MQTKATITDPTYPPGRLKLKWQYHVAGEDIEQPEPSYMHVIYTQSYLIQGTTTKQSGYFGKYLVISRKVKYTFNTGPSNPNFKVSIQEN